MALLSVAAPAAAEAFHAELNEETIPGPTSEGAAVASWPSAVLDLRPGEPGATWGAPRGMRAPESGYRDDGPSPHAAYLRFDGDDDVLVLEPATTAERYTTISMSFRAQPTGTYQVLVAFVRDEPGSLEPRRLVEVAIDEEGRPTFWMDPAEGGARITVPDAVTDGEWHDVSASYFHAPTGTIDAELVSDGAANTVRETWRAAGEAAFIGAPGSYHIGGIGTPGAAKFAFAGDVASSYIDHGGFDAGTAEPTTPAVSDAGDPVPPELEPEAAPRGAATIEATAESTADTVRFEVSFDGASGSSIVAVDERGVEHELGSGSSKVSWIAPGPGLYRFEARDYEADGSYAVLATVRALAMPAPRAPGDIMASALAATAIVGVSAALTSRGIDLWNILRRVALGRAQDRFYAATKETRIEQRVHLRSIRAAVVAMALMCIILSAGRHLENVAQGVFFAVLLVAGIAAVAFSVVMTGAQAALARVERATPRYRLWVAGALSLAVTTLAFGIPFGFAGNLSREPTPGAKPESDRQKALAAIVGICLVVAAAPLFLAIGAFTRFAFAEIAVAIALGGVFVSALPVRPLPGHVVWSWSKGAAVAILASGFALQSAYHLGALHPWAIVGIGIAALVLAATLTVVRVRGGREERGTRRAVRAAPPT